MDGSGTLQKSYAWGPGIDNLLAFTDHSNGTTTTYFVLSDHLGTVHAICDGSGTIVESYEFDAWGRVLGVYDSNGSPVSGSQIGNNYLWQGRWYSWEAGLHFFRARWYDPIAGRWLSKDPIGIAGGLNQYVFCGNDPVNSRDPLGFCEEQNPDGRWTQATWKDKINSWHYRNTKYAGYLLTTAFECASENPINVTKLSWRRYEDEMIRRASAPRVRLVTGAPPAIGLARPDPTKIRAAKHAMDAVKKGETLTRVYGSSDDVVKISEITKKVERSLGPVRVGELQVIEKKSTAFGRFLEAVFGWVNPPST